MTPKQVVTHFGTIAKAVNSTGFTRQVFYKWAKQGYIPLNSQWELKYEYGLTSLKIGKPYCKGDL